MNDPRLDPKPEHLFSRINSTEYQAVVDTIARVLIERPWPLDALDAYNLSNAFVELGWRRYTNEWMLEQAKQIPELEWFVDDLENEMKREGRA